MLRRGKGKKKIIIIITKYIIIFINNVIPIFNVNGRFRPLHNRKKKK